MGTEEGFRNGWMMMLMGVGPTVTVWNQLGFVVSVFLSCPPIRYFIFIFLLTFLFIILKLNSMTRAYEGVMEMELLICFARRVIEI